MIAALDGSAEATLSIYHNGEIAHKVAEKYLPIVLLLTAVPHALGVEGVFTRIGNWTKEIFSFGKLPEREFVYQTDHPGLQELYDTVTALGVERNVVPTWIPEGYQLEQLATSSKFENTTVIASFKYSKNQIVFNVILCDVIKNTEYHKNAEDVEVYEENGIKHYLMENNETWTVVWGIDNVECSMSAPNKEDLFKMISSMYCLERSI